MKGEKCNSKKMMGRKDDIINAISVLFIDTENTGVKILVLKARIKKYPKRCKCFFKLS